MACQCGCSVGVPRADVAHGGDCDCGCSSTQPGAVDVTSEGLDVASLARVVKELDQRVRQLELETSRN